MNAEINIPLPLGDLDRIVMGDLDRITIFETAYTWISTDADGHVLAPERFPERRQGFLHSELRDLVQSGVATVEKNYHVSPIKVSRNPVEKDLPDREEQCMAFYGDLCDALLQRVRDCGADEHFSEAFLARLLPELASEVALLAKKDKPCVLSHLPSPRQFGRLLKRHKSRSQPFVLAMKHPMTRSQPAQPLRSGDDCDGGCRIAAAQHQVTTLHR